MSEKAPDFEDRLKQAQKDDVAKAFAARPSPDGLSDIGLDALRTADKLLARFHEGERLDQPLACAAGCTFCCHQYVGISVPELAILAKYVTTHFSDEERRRLVRRLARVTAATQGMGRLARSSSNIDCPLLEPETRRCGAYAARPLTCRGMHSVNPTPAEKIVTLESFVTNPG